MALRFVDKRVITRVDQLTPVQQAQLRAAGMEYDGLDLPAAVRLADDGGEESFLGFCELWRLVEGEAHVFDAWLYMVDSGSFFRAGTEEPVGGIIQFGLEVDDPAIADRIGPAMVAARLLPRGDSDYARYAELLAAEGG